MHGWVSIAKAQQLSKFYRAHVSPLHSDYIADKIDSSIWFIEENPCERGLKKLCWQNYGYLHSSINMNKKYKNIEAHNR